MAEADRAKWNERYTAGDWDWSPVPRLVRQEAVLRPAGPALALDLACGAGRHTLYLARLGYTVDAWDVSEVGLGHLLRAAKAQGLAERVQTRQVDLDGAHLPEGYYDLVLDTYFLDRRLYGPMAAALKPGGLLFMETRLSTPRRPGRPDYYVQPSELRMAFPNLTELFHQEDAEQGWAALLARKQPRLSGASGESGRVFPCHPEERSDEGSVCFQQSRGTDPSLRSREHDCQRETDPSSLRSSG